jgi:uncharacterized protein
MATTAPDRHVTLDALRGFAVMGILLINIIAFSMPDLAFVSPEIYGGTTPADYGAWIVSFILVDGKMRGLFTLLFGASMMLVVERAEANGQSPARVHYSRLFWLAMFGLAHFFFLWWGDILFLYAGAGCVLFLMRNWEARTLIKWGVIFYCAMALLLTGGMATILALQIAVAAPAAGPEALADYQEAIQQIGFNDAQSQLTVYLGSYADILNDKLAHRWSLPLQNLILAPIETIPIMMIGMGLYKNRFMLGEWDTQDYWRIGLWLTAIGLVVQTGLAAIAMAVDYEPLWMFNITQAWAAFPRLILTIGYAALLVILIKRIAGSGILERVASAGRAAFTNYLGTSIVCTFIFYGWGLGLMGSIGRAQAYLFVLGVWAARSRQAPAVAPIG